MIRLGIVISEFHKHWTEKMLDYARNKAENLQVKIHEIVWIPGTCEMPLAVKRLIRKKNIDGIVLLGVVERGKTEHYRVIIDNATRLSLKLSLEYEKPVAIGIISGAKPRDVPSRLKVYAERSLEAAVKMVKVMKKL